MSCISAPGNGELPKFALRMPDFLVQLREDDDPWAQGFSTSPTAERAERLAAQSVAKRELF